MQSSVLIPDSTPRSIFLSLAARAVDRRSKEMLDTQIPDDVTDVELLVYIELVVLLGDVSSDKGDMPSLFKTGVVVGATPRWRGEGTGKGGFLIKKYLK